MQRIAEGIGKSKGKSKKVSHCGGRVSRHKANGVSEAVATQERHPKGKNEEYF